MGANYLFFSILEGILKNAKATEKEIEMEIKNWLRHAPSRFKRQQSSLNCNFDIY